MSPRATRDRIDWAAAVAENEGLERGGRPPASLPLVSQVHSESEPLILERFRGGDLRFEI